MGEKRLLVKAKKEEDLAHAAVKFRTTRNKGIWNIRKGKKRKQTIQRGVNLFSTLRSLHYLICDLCGGLLLRHSVSADPAGRKGDKRQSKVVKYDDVL